MEDNKVYRLYKGCWIIKTKPHNSQPISIRFAYSLLSGGGYFVRNICNWDKSEPSPFWYVIKDYYGGIEELPSKVRNQIRRSYKTYDIRMVEKDEMIDKGFELFNASRKRFGNSMLISKEQWTTRVSGDGQDFWMAIDKETGVPQAFGINRCYDDYCYYVSMGVNPDAPKSTYPMYGLINEMNRYYLEELKLLYVMDGARSVTEHSNIQPFLEEKFKFRKAYCDLKLYYKPWFGIVVMMLYPFRKWIKKGKIFSILRQEAWARGCEE